MRAWVAVRRCDWREARSQSCRLPAAQEWTLEALGNWAGFKDDPDGDETWDLEQVRQHNKVNEIDDDDYHLPGDSINENAITEGEDQTEWVVPGYDAAGNMLSGPKPGDEETRQHYKWDAWNRMVAVYADDDQNPGNPGDTLGIRGTRYGFRFSDFRPSRTSGRPEPFDHAHGPEPVEGNDRGADYSLLDVGPLGVPVSSKEPSRRDPVGVRAGFRV